VDFWLMCDVFGCVMCVLCLCNEKTKEESKESKDGEKKKRGKKILKSLSQERERDDRIFVSHYINDYESPRLKSPRTLCM
jgi:hypothetical protein